MKARLFVKAGLNSGESYLLQKKETSIGRGGECDIRLSDGSCSRRHCLFTLAGDGVEVVDLESKNGIAVNGIPVKRKLLRVGDEIRMGNTSFVFYADEAHASKVGHVEVVTQVGPPGAKTVVRRTAPTPLPQRPEGPTGALAALREIAASARSETDLSSLLAKLSKTFLTHTKAQRTAILLLDRETLAVRAQVQRQRDASAKDPVQVKKDAVEAVFRQHQSLLTEYPAEKDAERHWSIAVPLGVGPDPVGVLWLDTRGTDRRLTEDDLDETEALAVLAGTAIRHLEDLARSRRANENLRSALAPRFNMIGTSAPMRKVYEQIEKVCATDATVLVTGASGTGKELVANAIHYNSARKDGPIHCLNCGALPENLVESELFGHEKGAFTGAIALKKGAFELATGGTIFLDEVGEMDGKSQSKLLRVLEERVVRRVGGTEDIRVDVRIIAATNKDLTKEVPAGRFREDLLYRLRVIEIRLPSLRERRDDVAMLTDFYLAKFREEMGRKVEGISDAARKALEAHTWPGNVRELRNCLERAVLLASGPLLEPGDLGIKAAGPQADTEAFPTLKELEKRHIQAAIERAGGNKTEAAQILGIMRSTLYEKLKELESK